jgi:hypothetical protein
LDFLEEDIAVLNGQFDAAKVVVKTGQVRNKVQTPIWLVQQR